MLAAWFLLCSFFCAASLIEPHGHSAEARSYIDFQTGDTPWVSPGTGKTTCSFFQPGTDRVIFALAHGDPEAVAKQKAELDFRASGKSRRYSWDTTKNFEIYSARKTAPT